MGFCQEALHPTAETFQARPSDCDWPPARAERALALEQVRSRPSAPRIRQHVVRLGDPGERPALAAPARSG